MSPLVSVVIPAYNVERYIDECVTSVLDQTFPDFEIIAIDDGSSDSTGERLEALRETAKARGRTMRVVHQENHGHFVSRREGMRLAQGTFVALIDSDDRWLPRKLERQVARLQSRPDLDLTFCGFRVIGADGKPTGFVENPGDITLGFPDIFTNGCIGSATLLFGRHAAMVAAIGDEILTSNFDRLLGLRIAMMRANNIGCVGEVLAEYRKRPGQVTSDWHKHAYDWEILTAECWRFDPKLVEKLLPKARAIKYQYIASLAYTAGNFEAARRFMTNAWQTSSLTLLRRPSALRRMAQYHLLSLLPDALHLRIINSGRRFRQRVVRTG